MDDVGVLVVLGSTEIGIEENTFVVSILFVDVLISLVVLNILVVDEIVDVSVFKLEVWILEFKVLEEDSLFNEVDDVNGLVALDWTLFGIEENVSEFIFIVELLVIVEVWEEEFNIFVEDSVFIEEYCKLVNSTLLVEYEFVSIILLDLLEYISLPGLVEVWILEL